MRGTRSGMFPVLWQTRNYSRDRGSERITVRIWVAIPIVSGYSTDYPYGHVARRFGIWTLTGRIEDDASTSPCQGEAQDYD